MDAQRSTYNAFTRIKTAIAGVTACAVHDLFTDQMLEVESRRKEKRSRNKRNDSFLMDSKIGCSRPNVYLKPH